MAVLSSIPGTVRTGIVLACFGFIFPGFTPAHAQTNNEVINFAGNVDWSLTASRAVPDGTPLDGFLAFADTNTIAVSSSSSLTTYTNARASVIFYVNGTPTLYQGFQASVAMNVTDASGGSIPCSRLFITWGPPLAYSITMYSKITNYNNSWQIGITNTQWWDNRLPYRIDHVVAIGDTLAPLTAYGPPPVLKLVFTNGNHVISYPTNATGYTLEAATALPTNNVVTWQMVTTAPVVNGTNWIFTISNNPPIRFFRLGTTN